jgi:ADP-ribosylglycohydrolase
VTHFDPRCIASCIAGTTAIAMMLQGRACHSKSEIKSICHDAIEMARKVLKDHKDYAKEFTALCSAKKIKELELDEQNSIGYEISKLGYNINRAL